MPKSCFTTLFFVAYDLARQQKLNFGDDIAAMLRLAKKRKWERAEQERIQQEIELQSYLNHLIDNDKQKYVVNRRLEYIFLVKGNKIGVQQGAF